jgi:hypothetical protein
VPRRESPRRARRRRFAIGLLLRLLREPARLRPELGEDVVDAARFASDSTSCSSARAAAFVAAHAGDLLEQRAALLRPQRQRLVDHALADEQERVLGEMPGIEQVHQVLESYALAVQEVVVLARPVQPPAQLDHAVLDRQQAVAVVEGELDIGHAHRRPLLGASPDDILRLPRAEGAALLAERPAQGVGKVALAGAVRADDRADPRAELDMRSIGKRLEAWRRTESRRAGAVTAPGPRRLRR